MDVQYTDGCAPRRPVAEASERRETVREGKHSLRRVTRPALGRTTASHPRIVRRSDVWGGKAIVDGTRIPVFMISARLQSGWSPEEVREAYPRLTECDVEAVIRYAQAF